MTICIAANCQVAQASVVASDRMLSAPFLTLEFDHPDAKIDEISRSCVALSAGDALAAHEVLSDGPGPVGQLHDPAISDFVKQIRERFVDARKRLANEQILELRGLSFEQFYQHGAINRLPPDLAMTLDDAIQRMRLGVAVIVAGVDRDGPHIYGIEDPGTYSCYDRLSYHAIGSGHLHAMLALVAQNQHLSMGLNQTVFNVYCAKRAAEAAPGVGQSTEMRIVTRRGTRNLTQAELNQLAPLHEKRVKPKLTEVEQAISELPFEREAEQ
jgi:hypothetical protein